jgi:hypothetical protein
MIENKETNSIKNVQLNFEQGRYLENRCEDDRRRDSSEGFIYISSVGWIDRRERLRRKEDAYDF